MRNTVHRRAIAELLLIKRLLRLLLLLRQNTIPVAMKHRTGTLPLRGGPYRHLRTTRRRGVINSTTLVAEIRT